MIFDNQYIQERIKKTDELRNEGINPYPNITKDAITSKEFRETYEYVKENEDKRDESKNITLKGRIKLLRIMGKAAFAKLEDSCGLVQVYYSRDDLPEGY